MTSKELAPLQCTLDSILSRLQHLEAKVGIYSSENENATKVVEDSNEISSFDEFISTTVTPYVSACNEIPGLKNYGSKINDIFLGMKAIIQVASRCKKPIDVNVALQPFLKPIQEAISEIRKTRLDRKFDWHMKAIMEMCVVASWVVMSPPQVPSIFIKDTIGSTDFWANKIRKEHKGKDGGLVHITFCERLKDVISKLSDYVKKNHLSGLKWNPSGIDFEEYSVSDKKKVSSHLEHKNSSPFSSGSGDLMNELAARRTGDGSSAATGLKQVTRDQQRWRKEFSGDGGNIVSSKKNATGCKITKTNLGKKLTDPVCKLSGSKWMIENQTDESNPNGVCEIEIKNSKEQVYIFKCTNATIKIKGKLKSIILDSCVKSNLVFDSVISSCETVNCKRVKIQSTGVCPSFSIDKTDGCLVYLSDEAVSHSSFVTSKSSEMNVSWFDEKTKEQKEAPLPEQFSHKLQDGVVCSEVSDLYN